MNIELGRMPPISTAARAADARCVALDHMQKALEQLDSIAELSPVIGSNLQLAIDRLQSAMTEGQPAL